MYHVPTFNWFFEYQPIASEMLTQPSRYKWAERNLIADEKGPLHWIQIVFWIIHLYLYIYYYLGSWEDPVAPAEGWGDQEDAGDVELYATENIKILNKFSIMASKPVLSYSENHVLHRSMDNFLWIIK